MNVEIAQRLADLRRKKGYSQEELAERLGLSRQAVSKWERAESSPDTDNLIALARLYGTSLDELLAIEPIIEDDIAFETIDRAQIQEEKAAHEESFVQAAQSVHEANLTATQTAREAAEAASAAARAASEAAQATAQATAQAQAQAQAAQAQAAQAARAAEVQAAQAQAAYWQNNQAPKKADKVKSPLLSFPYPLVVVITYLFIGFFFDLWHPGWVLFLTIPFYYWIATIVHRDLNKGGDGS
ncbi:MAG: helix-turn-helix transcriptional regulator [Coriobacteriia bacterium]|nr:helix-turn-helix transcriptional regulator [Coriobacteriia bacterium]